MRILFAKDSDSKSLASLVIAFLEHEGHTVTHVETGLATVNAFA